MCGIRNWMQWLGAPGSAHHSEMLTAISSLWRSNSIITVHQLSVYNTENTRPNLLVLNLALAERSLWAMYCIVTCQELNNTVTCSSPRQSGEPDIYCVWLAGHKLLGMGISVGIIEQKYYVDIILDIGINLWNEAKAMPLKVHIHFSGVIQLIGQKSTFRHLLRDQIPLFGTFGGCLTCLCKVSRLL